MSSGWSYQASWPVCSQSVVLFMIGQMGVWVELNRNNFFCFYKKNEVLKKVPLGTNNKSYVPVLVQMWSVTNPSSLSVLEIQVYSTEHKSLWRRASAKCLNDQVAHHESSRTRHMNILQVPHLIIKNVPVEWCTLPIQSEQAASP